MHSRLLGITSLALLAAVFCIPASGEESGSAAFTIEGVAPAVCKLPEMAPSNAVNASMTGGAITVPVLVDSTDATVNAWRITVTFPGAMCNYNAFINIKSANGGLVLSDLTGSQAVTGSGTFLNKVDYKVTGTWGGLTIDPMDTATGVHVISQQTPGPNLGDLVLDLQADASATPLVRGAYRDQIEVSIGAKL